MSGHHTDTIEAYDEPTVNTWKWSRRKFFPNPAKQAKDYVLSLFPIVQWIYRYNLTWLYGDLIAGITVGCVVVPQGMSYATIATLPTQIGLYASFVGVFIYCFFATSKDVSIGPVAVMSLQVSKVIEHVVKNHPEYASDKIFIATTLSLLCGTVALGIGVLRLGFILEFIPIPAVMGFMSGSALNIVVGQVPSLFGIQKRLDTRAATYLVIINFFKQLKHAKLDTAFGLVCLFILYFIRWIVGFLSKRYPKAATPLFFIGVMRNGLVIIFATLISWGVCRHHKSHPPISIIKKVPRGLQDVGARSWDKQLMSDMASEIPVSTVVLLLEHIAISKSFGRINDYKINPNQELIAIGVTNLIGTFFNAYPATGSFSRSALKSKCGVRTPLAGIFTGAVVLLALYALTSAFYWIPNAGLSAVIIHAVGDLIAHPRTTFQFWKTSPLEAVMFIGAILFAVFLSIESGIYFSIAASLVLLLVRVAFPSGTFLGRVEYVQVVNPVVNGVEEVEGTDRKKGEEVVTTKERPGSSDGSSLSQSQSRNPEVRTNEHHHHPHLPHIEIPHYPYPDRPQHEQVDYHAQPSEYTQYTTLHSGADVEEAPSVRSHHVHRRFENRIKLHDRVKRYKWVPLSHKTVNPAVKIEPPPPGVIVFRPSESFTYPSCSRQCDRILDYAREVTRSGRDSTTEVKLGDRPWNDHGPRHRKPSTVADERPVLRAVVFDFSATPQADLTGVQALVDLKTALDKYANRQVEYHFVSIINPWIRRALLAQGFGTDEDASPERQYIQAGPRDPRFRGLAEGVFDGEVPDRRGKEQYKDEETRDTNSGLSEHGEYVPLVGTNTPFFHFDIPDLEFDDE